MSLAATLSSFTVDRFIRESHVPYTPRTTLIRHVTETAIDQLSGEHSFVR